MPGSYSNTGLENCHLCSKGTYQPKPYSNECLRCPGSSTTLSEGAKQLEECGSMFSIFLAYFSNFQYVLHFTHILFRITICYYFQ